MAITISREAEDALAACHLLAGELLERGAKSTEIPVEHLIYLVDLARLAVSNQTRLTSGPAELK